MSLKMVKIKDVQAPVVKNAPIEPGMYEDMAPEKYFSIDALSNSLAKLVQRSPAHAKVGFKSSRRMDLGSGAHGAILTPDTFNEEFVVLPPGITLRHKAGKEFKEEAEATGKTILTQSDMEKIKGMAGAVFSHPHAKMLFSGGLAETSWFWVHSQYPCLCKCRADYYREDMGILVDLKTTTDARESAVSRVMGNFRYHWQVAWYLDGASKVLGKRLAEFYFVFVETEPPYGVNCYKADEEMIQLARMQMSPVVNAYVECLKTDEWPCYPVMTSEISLPNWEIPLQMRKNRTQSAV